LSGTGELVDGLRINNELKSGAEQDERMNLSLGAGNLDSGRKSRENIGPAHLLAQRK
jgi:hypothetical protein